MIAARGLVIGVVVLHELRRVLRQRIDHATRQRVAAVFIVLGALCIHCFSLLKACLLRILTVKIAVSVHTGHVVHGHSGGSFDAGVNGSSIDRHTAPAADADDADALRVNILLHGEKVYCCTEILGIDVGRGHIARGAAALAGV